MPENNRIRLKKRLQQYAERITAFDSVNNRDLNHTEKWGLGSILGYLTGLIDGYGPYDRTGNFKAGVPEPPKKLKEKDLVLLSQVYAQVRMSVDRLNTRISQQYVAAPNSSAGRRLKARLRLEYRQNAKLYAMLTKDYAAMEKALMNTREKGREYTIHDIFEMSRVRSGYSVKKDSIKSTASGALSQRIPLTLTYMEGGHRKEQQGFFTRDIKTKEVIPTPEDVQKILGRYKSMKFLNERYVGNLLDYLREQNKDFFTEIRQRPGNVIFGNWEEARQKLAGFHSPDHNIDLFEKINSPEKLSMLVDILHRYCEINNVYNIHHDMGINLQGRINRRNSAMTQVANYLGCPNLLASSENVKLKIRGETVRGTFMKNAEGHDVRDKSADSPFLKTNIYSMDSLNLKKQIADLQVIDFICGNPDRHGGNVFYQFEKQEDGTTKLAGIQGIDNDLSFGTISLKDKRMSAVLIKDMSVITSDMANRVLDLNKDKLRQLLYGYELTEKELDAAAGRLKNLQDTIVRDAEEYARGYGECQLIPGKIKIVDDHELDLMPIQELCVGDDKNKNLFLKVYSNVSNGLISIESNKKSLENVYNKAAYEFVLGDNSEMQNLTSQLTADKVWHQNEQNRYNVITARMTALMERMASFTGPAKTENNQICQEFQNMVQEMRDIREEVDQYILYKDGKNEKWRRSADVNDPNHKQSLEERRYRHAVECRLLLDKKIRQFEKLDEPLREYREYLPKINGLRRAYRINKDKQEQAYIDDPKRFRLRETKVQSHQKRLTRILMDRLDEMRAEDDPDDPDEQEYQKKCWIREYGFGINSIEDEAKREELKNLLKNHDNTLVLEDDTTALKRALALDMIENRPGPHSPDPLGEADALIKTDYYNAFFNGVKNELISENARTSTRVVTPSYQDVQKYLTRLEGFRSLEQELQGVGHDRPANSNADSMNASLDSEGSGFNSDVSKNVSKNESKSGSKSGSKKEDPKSVGTSKSVSSSSGGKNVKKTVKNAFRK